MTFRHLVRLAAVVFLMSIASARVAFAVILSAEDYIETIAQAQADLDNGRINEARKKLESTDKSLRSFEYEYLAARAESASENTPAADLIQTVKAPEVDSRYAVLSESGSRIAFICRDGSVRIHDLRAPDTEPRVIMHEGRGPVWSGAFSLDGSCFVAGFEQGEVVVWDTVTWQPRSVITLEGKLPVRELAVAPDGSAFAAEGQSAIELWSLTGDKPGKLAEIGPRLNFGEGLAFSPKGDFVATGGMFDIVLFNARTGEQTRTMQHASYTMGLTFSPDGKRIASAPRGNVNRCLAVFEVARGETHFDAGPFPCYVHGGIFTADGKRIVSAACEKVPYLQLFDASTGEIVFQIARSAIGSKPAVSTDGSLFGWSEQGSYRFIDLRRKP